MAWPQIFAETQVQEVNFANLSKLERFTSRCSHTPISQSMHKSIFRRNRNEHSCIINSSADTIIKCFEIVKKKRSIFQVFVFLSFISKFSPYETLESAQLPTTYVRTCGSDENVDTW